MQRRALIQGAGATGLLALLGGCATSRVPESAKVVVVGGGYGGATAAKYVRLLSDHKIDVVLIEPNDSFISCPLSNLVLEGARDLSSLATSYDGLRRQHGITVVKDYVSAVDPARKTVTLARGGSIRYDKLVLSPGVELQLDTVPGLSEAHAEGRVLQAWKAGPETVALRKQLEALPDGGVYALTVPEAPYRCPPGPYERVALVASYFKKAKPKSKVVLFDANPDVTSKGALFKKAWSELYPGLIEYRPQHKVVGIEGNTLKFEVQENFKADVLNVLPQQRAGQIAVQTGLANSNKRWVGVDYLTFQSTAAKDIHVIGDAIQLAAGMPKSGHMANSHAKVAAAAIVSELSGLAPNPKPLLTNTCYSFVAPDLVVHVASVHEYVEAEKTFKTVAGSGGLSSERNALEARYALGWAKNIWADALG
ncbi:flavocytochrome C [Methylibium sp. Pch-M]|uniref:NAD(P)/FAD-dependent oxidoreductase n=1 Tax=Methylibium sp. Pch-M TaxID=2082386 RepID=UPI00101024CF|nr:FAD/NAD(P)-binding oxidoreductase [Methylibium sp. Pch-M]QAZ38084.1 flavocytochrome C [Methylibium sp. Pch-M]